MSCKPRVTRPRVTVPHLNFQRQMFLTLVLLACAGVGMQSWRATQAQSLVADDNAVQAQLDPTQPQVGPGAPHVGSNATRSAGSTSKPGSLLIFPKFTSDATRPDAVNTLLTITNTNPRDAVSVRVFFIYDCTATNYFVTLVANQSRTFIASKDVPGKTGYAVALAVNGQGLPTQFNWLIGAASLRDDRGHEAGYNAFSVAKRSAGPLRFNDGAATADVVFNNTDYDRLPKVVAIDSLQNQNPVSGAAVQTDVTVISPVANLSAATANAFRLDATAYDYAGIAFAQQVNVNCGLNASVNDIWTTTPFNSIIYANRPGWARLAASKEGTALPIIGLSLTDSDAAPLHNARVMQTLEWLDSFRLTVPVSAPGNPVADIVTQGQPEADGGSTGVSEVKAGSILIYPRFVSGANGNTQIYLTNTHPTQRVRLRVFFSGLAGTPEVKESIITLPALQTMTLQADALMPEQRGWAMVVAIDNRALPIQFNHLIGSAQVNDVSGQRASFNAVAVARNKAEAVPRNSDLATADVIFDDVNYDRLPATTALAFVPSQIDNTTLLGISRPAASLLEPPNTRTTATVMLYDELVAAFSASLSRTETKLNQIRPSVLAPPITNTILPGQHGWLKVLSSTPVFAWSLNMNLTPFTVGGVSTWRGGLSGDGNLHVLTTAETFTLKVPATNPNNHPPVAIAETIGLQIEARRQGGTIVRLDGSASSDEDAEDTLTYQWFDNDVPVSNARIADRKLEVGAHTIKLIVTDASGIASQPFEQTVTVVDSIAPLLSGVPSAISKVTDAPGGAVITFPLPVAYDMADGYVPVTASHQSGATFPLGRTTVTFTARDRAGNTSTARMDIAVSSGATQPQTGGVPGNHAPVLDNPYDQYVRKGEVRSLLLQATDADGDPVTFTLQGAPPYAQLITGDPGSRTATLRIAPQANDTAAATGVQITINDGRGRTFTTLPFRIIISDVPNDDTGSGASSNRPPMAVVVALPAKIQADSKTGADVTLDGSLSSDPDGDPLVYSWYDGDTLLARGAKVTVKLAVGVHLIRLTVFDGKDGLTSSAPMSVEVQPRALSLTSSSPNALTRPATATLTIIGTGFHSGAELRFSREGITVTNYLAVEEDKIVAVVSVAANAALGYRDIFVFNPNGQSVRLRSGLLINR